MMESIIFLSEKRDGTSKGRIRSNGSTQISRVSREKASIPMVTTDSALITRVKDSKQEKDIMSKEISNAFSQTKVLQGDERIIMKIRGVLVDTLLDVFPENTNAS